MPRHWCGLLKEKNPAKTGVYNRFRIDWKSGRSIYDSAKAQISAYHRADVINDEYPNRIGIVKLGHPYKNGYQFWKDGDDKYSEGDIEHYFNLFKAAKVFFDHENPKPEPKQILIEESFNLEKLYESTS